MGRVKDTSDIFAWTEQGVEAPIPELQRSGEEGSVVWEVCGGEGRWGRSCVLHLSGQKCLVDIQGGKPRWS